MDNAKLKKLIIDECGDVEKMDTLKKAEVFYDVYIQIAKIFKLDFNYGLQINELKEDAKTNGISQL